jgi:hypothetical protein
MFRLRPKGQVKLPVTLRPCTSAGPPASCGPYMTVRTPLNREADTATPDTRAVNCCNVGIPGHIITMTTRAPGHTCAVDECYVGCIMARKAECLSPDAVSVHLYSNQHAWTGGKTPHKLCEVFLPPMLLRDRLCGLVVRVLGYRSGGPGSFPGTTRKKNVVGLERDPLSLVSTTEELLDRKVAAPV